MNSAATTHAPELDGSRPSVLLLNWSQLVWLLLLVLLGRLFALHSCPIYDDAFITFRYARNLAAGLGMVFNPGASWEPVLGTTTPGFTAFLSVFLRLGFEPTTTAIALNIALDLASATMLIALFRRRFYAVTTSLLFFALLPQLVRISVGGMESPLLVALLLAAALASRAGRGLWTGLFVALACTVRPEAVLFTVVFGFAFLGNKRQLLHYATVIAVVGIVTAGWLTSIYGSPIPQSVQAKSSTHSATDAADNLSRLREIAEQAFLPTLWLAPLLPLVALGLWRSLRRREGLHLFGGAALAVVASYLAARPHTWGWYYYLPLVAWAVWLGYGVEGLAGRLLDRVPRERLEARARLALPALVGVSAIASGAVIWSNPDQVTAEVYRPLEEFIVARGMNRKTRVLASDIGAIGYWADCLVLDSEGLTWPDALEYKGDGPGMTNAQIELLAAHRPEYVIFVAERPRLAAFRARPELVRDYEPVARFNTDGDPRLEPPLEDLPGHWKQDYLVYKRRSER